MMKQTRLLSCLLACVILAGMLSVCGVGASAASAGPLSWGPEELKAEVKSSSVSLHTPQIAGISLAPGGSGWYMLHGLTCPVFDSETLPLFMSGDDVTMVIHAYAPDGDYTGGDFVQLNLANNVVSLTENISYSMYDEAEEKHSDEYGYDYKELSLSWTLSDSFDDDIIQSGAESGFQCRVRGYNTFTTNLYYLAILCNGEMIFEADGEKIFYSGHENANLLSPVEVPSTAASVAIKAAAADFPDGGTLFENLGGELAAGEYIASISLCNRTNKNENTMGPNDSEEDRANFFNKALVDVTLTGAGDPIQTTYTRGDMCGGVSTANCTSYDTIEIPFTLADDGRVGMDIATQGVYDLLISNITIERKLSEKEKDAKAVNEAIQAIGNVTEETYQAIKPKLETAEALYQNFVQKYSQADADQMIPHAGALVSARTEYDRIVSDIAEREKQEKKAAVQKAIDAITAVGAADDINSDNVDAKQTLVDAADAAIKALTDAYGQEALSEVTNSDDLKAAKDKIAEINAKPEYVLGDINDDESIDAADALMALQHSVDLITLNETEFLAADVDGNETVDASDALMILQCSVELIRPEDFPAAKK